MALTQQDDISTLLPNELLIQVIDAAPKADQVTLCRVSKLFHALAVPAVYGAVNLPKYTSIISFCSAVLSNASLAKCVQSINICLPTSRAKDSTWSQESSGLILDSVETLLELRHLSLDTVFLRSEHRDAILRCTFPHLLSCDIQIEEDKLHTFTSFLTRHPALTRMHVRLWRHIGNFRLDSPTPIPLLNLRHYRGPVQCLSWITTHNLREAELDWPLDKSSESSPAESLLLALQATINSDIPFVSSNYWCDDYFTEIVDFLSRNIPQTRTLQMDVFHLHDDQIAHVMSSLPRFTGLVFFAIKWAGMMPASHIWGNEAATGVTAQTCGDLCPTLEACCLGRWAWRKINGRWEAYPRADFPTLAGISWP
ncbi:hypothetical protein DFH07DRAFT_780877 [Mycena maculata]|uniref:F-box domain-containing protein n=1 Tax=Mycena maculata TaxID=230809 RepID=A0AAD7MVL1_9AGAR|nr:hypothetical protein DFH07DRAFT_780877 [Mycena maculata]